LEVAREALVELDRDDASAGSKERAREHPTPRTDVDDEVAAGDARGADDQVCKAGATKKVPAARP
jgi:hypothetical protein